MDRRPALRALGLLACAPLLACGGPTGDAANASTPYPNRRAKFESAGHVLGYVANRQSDTVSVLDLDTMSELGAPPVGRDPVDTDGPRHVVLDAAAGELFVVLSYPDPAVADPHANGTGAAPRSGYVVALALDDLRPLGELRVSASPNDVALSDDGAALAVPHYDSVLALKNTANIDERRATLGLVVPARGVADESAELTSVPVCVAPASAVYDARGARAYVTCTGEDLLAVVDTAQASVLSRVPAGTSPANKPYALTRNAAATRLAVSNQVAQTVVLFSAEDTPSLLLTAVVPGVPFFSAWLGDDRLLVPLQDPNGAALVDVATGAVSTRATYADSDCQNPSDATVLRDGRFFLTCEGDHYRNGAVVELDPESLSVLSRVEVGVYPDRLAVLLP
jgi:DNA-binding beta-propeller fold protein YncE